MRSDCLAAAILAGGRARRFGGIDKSALAIDGVPIMSRLVDLLRRITPHLFAVGDRYGGAAAADLHVVEDAIAEGGVLGAIYTAVVASPCERTLVVGCDMPFLTEPFLRHVIDLSAVGDQPRVVMPRTAEGYEPLCAVYTRDSAPAIRSRLERGERQAAVPPGGVQVVEVGPQELAVYDPHGLLFVNVNTPHDYAQALRRINGRDLSTGSGQAPSTSSGQG